MKKFVIIEDVDKKKFTEKLEELYKDTSRTKIKVEYKPVSYVDDEGLGVVLYTALVRYEV